MKVTVPTINGYLADRYGKYAVESDKHQGTPTRSFPITISEAPAGTQSFALWLIDYDAVPVSGFPWIHWTAANIPAGTTLIPDDASHQGTLKMVQGHNSTSGHLVGSTDPVTATGYVGPQPPNADHAYTLTVFALDTTLALQNGYWLSDLRHAMQGHILAQVSQDLWSRQ
ncbi:MULTISPECIES: YbhB/YbcL family Raf kinase inhibitor-like protein [unclassified Lacticaseibacillus]|uniref:YbhB/YbcL family Raf kinase inhibitor-like protein n=1 Tax=unclassified Lacticaseibacillus TaxID=2759744 RepID=UPI001942BB38|nr:MULTISPECIES: YbhB/YbcL family Raf kinase inhibitor-like protein [unclassified Lacticaseibacillus]